MWIQLSGNYLRVSLLAFFFLFLFLCEEERGTVERTPSETQLWATTAPGLIQGAPNGEGGRIRSPSSITAARHFRFPRDVLSI